MKSSLARRRYLLSLRSLDKVFVDVFIGSVARSHIFNGQPCVNELLRSPIPGFVIIKKALDHRVGMKRGYEFRKQVERIENDAVILHLGVKFPPREKVHEALEELELVTISPFDCRYGLGCKTTLKVGIA